MRDKTEQIVEAAIAVFVDKGFIQATTQEIASVANVAEVTLYRKFKTKQNLFEFVVRRIIEETLQDHLSDIASQVDTDAFFTAILRNRLYTLSKHRNLVRLLIRESIAGNLPESLNFLQYIFNHLQSAIALHFDPLQKSVDATFLARQLGSILLGYAILPSDILFHQLDNLSQDELLNQHVQSIMVNL